MSHGWREITWELHSDRCPDILVKFLGQGLLSICAKTNPTKGFDLAKSQTDSFYHHVSPDFQEPNR